MSRESVELGELIFPAKVIRCGRDEYPVFSMTMHDGIVEQKTRFKKALASKDQSNYKVVKPGQLVVGFPIDEGVLYIQQLGKKGIMSPAYNIWDVDQEKVYPEFLELALHSPQSMSWYKAKLRGTTARRRNIPAKDLIKLRICLPEKSVQSRIVDTFQQIKEELSSFASLNEKLDDLVKSRFVEMSNSEECSKVLLGSLVRSMHIGPFGSALKNDAFVSRKKASCVVYEQKHAINKRIDFNWRYVDESKRAELKRFEVGPGTILVSCRGTLGKVYQLPDRAPIGIIHPSLMKIEINDSKVDATYFVSLLEELFTEAEARAEGSGVKMAIRAKELGVAEVEIPSLDKQKRFATFVHQVDKLKFETQQSIEKLQTLYDSLAQEYFAPEGD